MHRRLAFTIATLLACASPAHAGTFLTNQLEGPINATLGKLRGLNKMGSWRRAWAGRSFRRAFQALQRTAHKLDRDYNDLAMIRHGQVLPVRRSCPVAGALSVRRSGGVRRAPASPLRPLLIPRRERCLCADAAQAASSTERPTTTEQTARARPSDHGQRARAPEADGANDQRECHHSHPRPRISSSSDGEAELELRYLIGPQPPAGDLLPPRARTLDWATLLKRVYDVDVLHCPRCSGRLEVIAAISERLVVAKILAHLGLPTSLPQPAPARAPPWAELEFDYDLDDNELSC